jgi:hypothetical protein
MDPQEKQLVQPAQSESVSADNTDVNFASAQQTVNTEISQGQGDEKKEEEPEKFQEVLQKKNKVKKTLIITLSAIVFVGAAGVLGYFFIPDLISDIDFSSLFYFTKTNQQESAVQEQEEGVVDLDSKSVFGDLNTTE